jgi:hypothetical protein
MGIPLSLSFNAYASPSSGNGSYSAVLMPVGDHKNFSSKEEKRIGVNHLPYKVGNDSKTIPCSFLSKNILPHKVYKIQSLYLLHIG